MGQRFNRDFAQEVGFNFPEDGHAPKIGESVQTKSANQSNFIGKSPAFDSIIEMIDAVAKRKCPIIITGETGVGKEMVARQIHSASDRADKIFVPGRLHNT